MVLLDLKDIYTFLLEAGILDSPVKSMQSTSCLGYFDCLSASLFPQSILFFNPFSAGIFEKFTFKKQQKT